MSDLLSWPIGFRVSYLRAVWARVAESAAGDRGGTAGRPVALFGAGRHTTAFLPIISSSGPTVSVILDDNAGAGAPKEVHGVRVARPADVRPDTVGAVVVSSDSMEERLAERAAAWADGRVPVIRLYGAAFEPLRNEHRARSRGVWGTTLIERNGHLPITPDEPVLRLGRAPRRSAEDPLPLPPPELRAGYHPADDRAYLDSGARDTAAFRRFIRHAAPDAPMTRVLDWGCSSGRMLRHWSDIAASGGDVWGCDICATAVNWASEHLSPPFRFVTCTTRPPLPFADGAFDVVYAKSVFTHVRELYDAWLMEMRRVLRPGGVLVATILDEHWWDVCGTNPENSLRKRCPEIDFTAPLQDDFVARGGAFDPVTFWHTEGVRRRWSFALDVVGFERSLVPYQTGVLLRRPR